MPPHYHHHEHEHEDHHHSIAEKVYKLLVWLTNPDSNDCLVLYGPMASGKTVALKEALYQLERMKEHHDRYIPESVSSLQEGKLNKVFEVYQHEYHYHSDTHLLPTKTIVIITSHNIPRDMPYLLHADVLKFEHE